MLGCWKNCYSFTCNLLLAELTAFPIAMVETPTESNLQRIHRGLQRERVHSLSQRRWQRETEAACSLLGTPGSRERKSWCFSAFVLPPFYSVWGSGPVIPSSENFSAPQLVLTGTGLLPHTQRCVSPTTWMFLNPIRLEINVTYHIGQ